MNAIQYFDWGYNGNNIPFCQVRVKDYFTTQKGKNIERHIPLQGDYRSIVNFGVITPSGVESVDVKTKKFEIIREGNDIVCKTYIKSNFRETRKLTGVAFHTHFNSRPYINSESYVNFYINGRKVKTVGGMAGIVVEKLVISFYSSGGDLEKGMMYEDNGEAIPFQSLFEKELTIVLN